MNRVFFILTFCLWMISPIIYAAGALFNIRATGGSDNVNITLCLNGKGPISCQNFNVSGLNLQITTTVPNHLYSFAGIKINTPNHIILNSEVCTPLNNGFCLFVVSDTSPAVISLFPPIGTSYEGGVVGCLEGEPYMNFIAASSDSINGIPWGGFGITTGADSSFDGAGNTRLIIRSGVTNSAANLCSETINGYSDWFLPAKEQLNCLYKNQTMLPGFMNAIYWSSTEDNENNALFQFFDNSNQLSIFKTFYSSVRCVRIAT